MATVPIPWRVNARSTKSRVGPETCVGSDAVCRCRERRSQLVQPLFRLRARGDDRRIGDELACLLDGERERLLVHRVSLRHGDDSAVDSEQLQDGEVLVRLWPCAFACVDDEQEEVDAGRARDHRAHETLVARDVDE